MSLECHSPPPTYIGVKLGSFQIGAECSHRPHVQNKQRVSSLFPKPPPFWTVCRKEPQSKHPILGLGLQRRSGALDSHTGDPFAFARYILSGSNFGASAARREAMSSAPGSQMRSWFGLCIICVPCWQLALCLQKPRQQVWLKDLCAWLRLHNRRPHRFGAKVGSSEAELEERLQYGRCAHVRRLLRRNELSKEQLDMLEPHWHVFQPSTSTAEANRTAWLEDLCAWLRLHKRRPYHFVGIVGLNESAVEERLQYKRCSQVRSLHRKNALSQSQLDMLEPFWNEVQLSATTAEATRTAWLEYFCAWLGLHRRRPRRLRAKVGLSETELEEQLQYARWTKVRALRRKDQLSQKHVDMLQPVWNDFLLGTSDAELKRTAWIEQLLAWLRLHKRRPRRLHTKVHLNEAEKEEQLYYFRCKLVGKLHHREKLDQNHVDMLQPVWHQMQPLFSTARLKQTTWLEDLCAWLKLHKRRPYHFEGRPSLNETELEEQLQYRRCSQVRKLRRRKELSQKQLDILQPFEKELELQRSPSWLEDLCTWLRLHKRRPYHFEGKPALNESEVEERLQYWRCSAVRKLLRRHALSKEQLDMLQPFRTQIEAQGPSRAVGRRPREDWLEDLCDWLRFHRRRPRRLGTEIESWLHDLSSGICLGN